MNLTKFNSYFHQILTNLSLDKKNLKKIKRQNFTKILDSSNYKIIQMFLNLDHQHIRSVVINLFFFIFLLYDYNIYTKSYQIQSNSTLNIRFSASQHQQLDNYIHKLNETSLIYDESIQSLIQNIYEVNLTQIAKLSSIEHISQFIFMYLPQIQYVYIAAALVFLTCLFQLKFKFNTKIYTFNAIISLIFDFYYLLSSIFTFLSLLLLLFNLSPSTPRFFPQSIPFPLTTQQTIQSLYDLEIAKNFDLLTQKTNQKLLFLHKKYTSTPPNLNDVDLNFHFESQFQFKFPLYENLNFLKINALNLLQIQNGKLAKLSNFEDVERRLQEMSGKVFNWSDLQFQISVEKICKKQVGQSYQCKEAVYFVYKKVQNVLQDFSIQLDMGNIIQQLDVIMKTYNFQQ